MYLLVSKNFAFSRRRKEILILLTDTEWLIPSSNERIIINPIFALCKNGMFATAHQSQRRFGLSLNHETTQKPVEVHMLFHDWDSSEQS